VALSKFTLEQEDACIRVAEFVMWEKLRRLDGELFRSGRRGSHGRPWHATFIRSWARNDVGAPASESCGSITVTVTFQINSGKQDSVLLFLQRVGLPPYTYSRVSPGLVGGVSIRYLRVLMERPRKPNSK
jgi:hypothetical protein